MAESAETSIILIDHLNSSPRDIWSSSSACRVIYCPEKNTDKIVLGQQHFLDIRLHKLFSDECTRLTLLWQTCQQ